MECDRALPGLSPAPHDGPPDVRFWLGTVPSHAFPDIAEEPWYAAAPDDADAPGVRVTRAVDGSAFRLRYPDGIEFRIDAAGTAVACTWPPSESLEAAATYLLGALCGLLLRLRGTPSLHASAVTLRDGAVALCGPPHAGKSTTAAALAARGHRVLSDDVVPLREDGGRILAYPAYPHLRLWPDVLSALFSGQRELPALMPEWDKRWLDVNAAFQDTPLPLRAVYVLSGREHAAVPTFAPLAPREALLELLANAYMGWFPDTAAQAREFALLGRVAREVPVVTVTPLADSARVHELAAAVEEDFIRRTEGGS